MLSAFILNLIFSFSAPAPAGEINFVYPPKDEYRIPAVQKTFVFGNIKPSTAALTINGSSVSVYGDGAFIAYLPVSSDTFSFVGRLDDGTTAVRTVKIGNAYVQDPKAHLMLNITSLYSDMAVEPGDPVKVYAAAMPDQEVTFSIENIAGDIPMTESPAGSGSYVGTYWTGVEDTGKSGRVSVRISRGLFRKDYTDESKGLVRVLGKPTLVQVSDDRTVMRNASSGGYMLFMPEGVKLISTGSSGNMTRVQLSESEIGWVSSSKVRYLNGQPIPPFTETGNIQMQAADYGSDVTVSMSDKVPYVIEETDGGIKIRLYYTSNHTNWIVYDSSDTFVKEVTSAQVSENTDEINIRTSEPVWGYEDSYEGNNLKLSVRRRPAVKGSWPKPLSGITIVVDPGHSPKYDLPYDGAIGPMGLFEFQANRVLADKLKEKLVSLGANAVFTREANEEVKLADRPVLAKSKGGDIFISLHNNALSDGKDPFVYGRGFEIYFYHRHSMGLARKIHDAYVEGIMPKYPVLKDNGLRYGDYLVTRQTWMPAVLTESVYMMMPEQEALLMDDGFQTDIASVTARGIMNFFGIGPEPAPAPKTLNKKAAGKKGAVAASVKGAKKAVAVKAKAAVKGVAASKKDTISVDYKKVEKNSRGGKKK